MVLRQRILNPNFRLVLIILELNEAPSTTTIKSNFLLFLNEQKYFSNHLTNSRRDGIVVGGWEMQLVKYSFLEKKLFSATVRAKSSSFRFGLLLLLFHQKITIAVTMDTCLLVDCLGRMCVVPRDFGFGDYVRIVFTSQVPSDMNRNMPSSGPQDSTCFSLSHCHSFLQIIIDLYQISFYALLDE